MTDTFEYDLYRLAVGVIYVNLGLAVIDFPSTSRAHPSYLVVLTFSGDFADPHRKLFPFSVSWAVWETVVVPLFADGAGLVKVGADLNETLRQQINRDYVRQGDWSPLIEKVKRYLRDGLQAWGRVPVGTDLEVVLEPESPPGGVLVPPGTNDGSPFLRFD